MSILPAQYVEELYKRKQSDVLRFLLRVRCWEYRQLPGIMRLTGPTRPDKARRMGYKAKQGYVVYRVRVRRGGRKKPVHKVWISCLCWVMRHPALAQSPPVTKRSNLLRAIKGLVLLHAHACQCLCAASAASPPLHMPEKC